MSDLPHTSDVSPTPDAAAPEASGKPAKVSRGKKSGGGGRRTEGGGRRAEEEEEETFDPAQFVRGRRIWWLDTRDIYFMPGPDGGWMQLTMGNFIRWLEAEGLRRGTASAPTMDVERVLLWVQGNRRIAGVMNLAGHVPGVEVIRGARVLIREGPSLIPPVEGEWPLVQAIFRNLFCLPLESGAMPAAWRLLDEKDRDYALERDIWELLCRPVAALEGGPFPGDDGIHFYFDQRDVIFSWLKLSLEVLYRRAAMGERGLKFMRNGQILALAGPPKGGKSLFFNFILAPLMGNRMSDASKYFTGKTTFNANLFGSELLVLSDTPLSNKTEDRNTLGDNLKRIAAEQWHAWEGKGKDAMDQLNPIWRGVVGLNDDPNNIRTLPSFSVEGVGDKIHLLHAASRRMPMPTTTLDEYLAFSESVAAELPAFVHWLMNVYEIPKLLLGSRFGMRTIQSPDLMQEMFEESPSGELLELIDLARWTVSGDVRTFWEQMLAENDGGNMAHGRVECLRRADRSEGPPVVWQGSALDLKHHLSDDRCSVHREAQQLFKWHKPERLLARLAKENHSRVEQHRTKLQRQWRVAVAAAALE